MITRLGEEREAIREGKRIIYLVNLTIKEYYTLEIKKEYYVQHSTFPELLTLFSKHFHLTVALTVTLAVGIDGDSEEQQ